MTGRLVMKFGGTSVGSAAAVRQVAGIVQDARQKWSEVVVVTSALSGVTDRLIECARRASHGDLAYTLTARADLEERHITLLLETATPAMRPAALSAVRSRLDELEALCGAVSVLHEVTPRTLDAVASLGERMSAPVLAAAISSAGVPSTALDAATDRLIITDDHYNNAQPDMAATTANIQARMLPLMQAGQVPVVTGFIGATPGGEITTLGRGGSDYSASILGVALAAAEVWIWTDVDGVMTADPRWVADAHTLPELTYREVAELAHYGAKVLQPRSIHPVIRAGIPVRVCNTFNPTHPGTRLVEKEAANGHGVIKSIAVLRCLYLVIVAGRGMIGVPGIAGRTFSAVASAGVSIPLIIQSSSEQSICFAVPKESAEAVIRSLKRDFAQEIERQDIESIQTSGEVDVITILCPSIRNTSGVTGSVFGVLGEQGINVLAISFGASDISINLVVDSSNTGQALKALHPLTRPVVTTPGKNGKNAEAQHA